MRYFNTHGPVNAQEHYVVARRALVERLVGQIEQGKYFTISSRLPPSMATSST
jgi:hypothetical protein